jgi:MoaA/NifB/PqqE/SkfB family radical SAM enzyme
MDRTDLLYYLSWITNTPLAGPSRLQIDLTHRCNLNCSMCSVDRYPTKKGDELTKEEIGTLILEAKEMGVRKVIFAGGEPFLYEDLLESCSFCQENRLVTVVVTNGTLIGGMNFARKIVDSGLSCLSISIDGLRETHDSFRGAGNFDRSIAALQYLVKAKAERGSGPSLNVGCIVSEKNVSELPDLAAFLESKGAEFMHLMPLMSDNTSFKSGKPDEHCYIADLEKTLLELRRKYFPGSSAMGLMEGVPLELVLKHYRKGMGEKDWMCYAGFDNIFITLCNPERTASMQSYVRFCMGFGGNVKEKSLREIWHSRGARKLRRELKRCKTPCLQSCFYGRTPTLLQRCINSAARLI